MRFNIAILLLILPLSLPVAAQVLDVEDSLSLIANYRFYDKPVDPELYLIRPGEKLVITFLKTKLPQLWLQVNPEGKLIDKSLGMFDLAGRTLAETRSLLYQPLQELYNAREIDISVREPYQVGVAVTGEVNNPDIYLGFTSFLSSEMITAAGGVKVTGSTRNIIFSGGKKDIRVDLDRFRYLGDNTCNPCLYAGNRLFVPRKSKETVNIVGEVNCPRAIELLPEDNLELLLALAGGITDWADLEAVYISGDPERDVRQPGNIHPGDVIMVPALDDRPSMRRLLILGAIKNPGYYPFQEALTLKNLLDAAGGLNANANFDNATVFRRVEKSRWEESVPFRFPINKYSMSDGKFENFILKPSDSVFIPPEMGFVKVSGYVMHPGYFPFSKGQNALYYINLAGGFQRNAERGFIKIFDRISKTTRLTSTEPAINDGNEVIIEAMEVKP